MRFVAILKSGHPEEPLLDLPQEAVEVGLAYIGLYQKVGYQAPWLGYLAFIDGVCVGSCGFKSPPHDNRVEIAYFTFPAFEGKGIATQMARALVEISIRAAPQATVAAQTLPMENASTTILKQIGFKHVTTLEHPEDGLVWEWHLAKQSFGEHKTFNTA
jgi:[ribosomal protein S5]-alanine N-acetyltransferase